MLVLGLNFITGLTGQMNLATAGMLALGAYTYGVLTTTGGWEPWVALFALFAVGLALGRCLGFPSLRLKGFFLSLTTIGFTEIVRLLASNLADVTGGTMGLSNIPHLSFFFAFADKNSYFYLNLIFTVILTLIAIHIVYSKWGRAYKAIRDNVEAAEADGIHISKLKIQAFTLASIYAVIAAACTPVTTPTSTHRLHHHPFPELHRHAHARRPGQRAGQYHRRHAGDGAARAFA